MIEGVKDEEEDVRFHRHDQFNVFEDFEDLAEDYTYI